MSTPNHCADHFAFIWQNAACSTQKDDNNIIWIHWYHWSTYDCKEYSPI